MLSSTLKDGKMNYRITFPKFTKNNGESSDSEISDERSDSDGYRMKPIENFNDSSLIPDRMERLNIGKYILGEDEDIPKKSKDSGLISDRMERLDIGENILSEDEEIPQKRKNPYFDEQISVNNETVSNKHRTRRRLNQKQTQTQIRNQRRRRKSLLIQKPPLIRPPLENMMWEKNISIGDDIEGFFDRIKYKKIMVKKNLKVIDVDYWTTPVTSSHIYRLNFAFGKRN